MRVEKWLHHIDQLQAIDRGQGGLMKNLTTHQQLEWIEDPDRPEQMRLWLDEEERMEMADKRILTSHWYCTPPPHRAAPLNDFTAR